jgi:hypothetical protein
VISVDDRDHDNGYRRIWCDDVPDVFGGSGWRLRTALSRDEWDSVAGWLSASDMVGGYECCENVRRDDGHEHDCADVFCEHGESGCRRCRDVHVGNVDGEYDAYQLEPELGVA